jgi:hypothetical protein
VNGVDRLVRGRVVFTNRVSLRKPCLWDRIPFLVTVEMPASPCAFELPSGAAKKGPGARAVQRSSVVVTHGLTTTVPFRSLDGEKSRSAGRRLLHARARRSLLERDCPVSVGISD